tara:strand:+ start:1354 stop:1530 length:177 start_codon:yes stop_codon:yes gene_type:complete
MLRIFHVKTTSCGCSAPQVTKPKAKPKPKNQQKKSVKKVAPAKTPSKKGRSATQKGKK